MVVLVPPVKARNSIDITSTRETTKTRVMTTASNSLKLSFTDVVDCSPLFILRKLRRAFCLHVGLRLTGFFWAWRNFAISCLGPVMPFNDFASRRRLLIRDSELSIGIAVNVIILGVALCNHSETKKKRQTKCKVQSLTSPRVSDPLVCSSMVFFNIWSETGFIK
jgi:hypothetical protein